MCPPPRRPPAAESEGEAHLREPVGPDVRVRVGRGAGKDQVERLARELGVTLPASYRRFLEACGHAQIDSEEILGIGGDYGALKATRAMREWAGAGLARSHGRGRGGRPRGMLRARIKGEECPVVYFDHELADIDDDGTIRPHFERCKPGFNAWLRACGKSGSLLPAGSAVRSARGSIPTSAPRRTPRTSPRPRP